jgi:hypothetical protein
MRTAVCFCGQPRHIEKCIDSIKEYVIEPNNADVFFHFWATHPSETHRWHHSEDIHWKTLSFDTLRDMLNPKAFAFGPQVEFDVSAFPNAACPTYNVWSWTYSARICHELYDPTEYDCVVHCRPDLYFHDTHVIDSPKNDEFHVEYRQTPGDQYAYGTPETMKIFGRFHDKLPALYDEIGVVHCETMLQKHMEHHGRTIHRAPVKYTLWRMEHNDSDSTQG